MDLKIWLEDLEEVCYDCINQIEDLIILVTAENKGVRNHKTWNQMLILKGELEKMMTLAYDELEKKHRN